MNREQKGKWETFYRRLIRMMTNSGRVFLTSILDVVVGMGLLLFVAHEPPGTSPYILACFITGAVCLVRWLVKLAYTGFSNDFAPVQKDFPWLFALGVLDCTAAVILATLLLHMSGWFLIGCAAVTVFWFALGVVSAFPFVSWNVKRRRNAHDKKKAQLLNELQKVVRGFGN